MKNDLKKSSDKSTLEEGKYYPFKITGSVKLPDGRDCFILSDINQVKHLLYKEYYTKYQFELNQVVRCRIDKINCAGKIYIEPEHPFYKLGETYSFVFDRYVHVKSSNGEYERLAILKNGNAEDIWLAADDTDAPLSKGERITGIVERIKNGRVYISLGSPINDYSGMEAGKRYRFTLSHEANTGNRYASYVLLDDKGKEFRIRKKFYSGYGFNQGDLITCELIETDHQVFLEPLHPFYEAGFIYDFQIIGETRVHEYPDQEVEAYLLNNEYGKDIILKKKNVSKGKVKGDMVKCTVTAIKKSQVFLACS